MAQPVPHIKGPDTEMMMAFRVMCLVGVQSYRRAQCAQRQSPCLAKLATFAGSQQASRLLRLHSCTVSLLGSGKSPLAMDNIEA